MKGCNGACDQGRKACPTPDACEIPEEDKQNVVGLLLIAFSLVCALAMVVVVIR